MKTQNSWCFLLLVSYLALCWSKVFHYKPFARLLLAFFLCYIFASQLFTWLAEWKILKTRETTATRLFCFLWNQVWNLSIKSNWQPKTGEPKKKETSFPNQILLMTLNRLTVDTQQTAKFQKTQSIQSIKAMNKLMPKPPCRWLWGTLFFICF